MCVCLFASSRGQHVGGLICKYMYVLLNKQHFFKKKKDSIFVSLYKSYLVEFLSKLLPTIVWLG